MKITDGAYRRGQAPENVKPFIASDGTRFSTSGGASEYERLLKKSKHTEPTQPAKRSSKDTETLPLF